MTVGNATNVKTGEGLKPCPFCGAEPISLPSGNGEGLMIQCIYDRCRVGPHVSYIPPAAAITAWNVRVQQAPPPEDDPEPPEDDEDEYGPDREETDDR